MVDWAMMTPAIGVLVVTVVLWLWARRIHANLLRSRDRARAEKEGRASS